MSYKCQNERDITTDPTDTEGRTVFSRALPHRLIYEQSYYHCFRKLEKTNVWEDNLPAVKQEKKSTISRVLIYF